MNLFKSLSVLFFSLLAFYLGAELKPVYIESKDRNILVLEEIIPLEFKGWRVDESLPIVLGSPEQDKLLSIVYSQQLSRTYVDDEGHRVMLSISYGDIQNKAYQVHFPEVCYPAQGFEILKQSFSSISLNGYSVPTKRLETKQGSRWESVSYWIRHGDDIVLSRFQQKVNSIMSGLKGNVPDGLLFRVSTINIEDGYILQEEFITQLFNELSFSHRTFLIGGR